MKKQKGILLTLLFIFSFFIFMDNAYAVEAFNLCTRSGTVKVFQIIGYCLYIVKIIVPILLIVISAVEFGKAVLASDENAIKGAITISVKRCIAAILIFFIPTALGFIFNLIDGSSTGVRSKFSCLNNCVFYPTDKSKCVVPSDGGVFAE